MNNTELIEYAVYHWVLGGDHNLPGLNKSGFFDSNFFGEFPVKSNYEDFSDQFALIQRDPDLFNNDSLMLCSGGVDSSLLACFRKDNLKANQQSLMHTTYVGHNNNDLYKFNSILDYCPSNSFVSSIDEYGYMSGLELLTDKNFFQNTYAPTLAFALNSIGVHKFSCLITGSGPDELFYGMEKYSWDVFEELSEIPISKALEILDPKYNSDCYAKLFNAEGKELFQVVRQKRQDLYINIAELGMSIFDSQRLLAYSTVTAQHMQMFNTVAKFFNLEHKAPYLNNKLIRLALSTPLSQLIHLGADKRVEIGKKYLKKYLKKYMSEDHVYGKKIGFHAPTTRFVYEYGRSFLIENIDFLPSWLDKDLTLSDLTNRYANPPNTTDYFLYSLINVMKHNMRNSDAC